MQNAAQINQKKSVEIKQLFDLFAWTKKMSSEWDFEKPLFLKWSEKKETRNAEQNSLYWIWLKEEEKQTGIFSEELHYKYKYQYAVNIFTRDDLEYSEMICSAKQLRKLGYENDYVRIRDFIVKQTSTTDFTVAQMAEYMNKIWMNVVIEKGIKLTHPDEKGMEWMKIK